MVRTRMKLLPREIDGRLSRSFVARGYLHALYLKRCDSRLRQPISHAVGWTMFCYFPGRRRHPAYRSRHIVGRRQAEGGSYGGFASSTSVLLIEIADADGTHTSREIFGEERAYYERLIEEQRLLPRTSSPLPRNTDDP
jgi:hypothetical protein